MKVVKYISNHNGYGAGEKAGWPDEFADTLVEDGVAEHYDPKAEAKAKAKAEKIAKAAKAKAAKAKAERAKAKVNDRETKPVKNIVEK